jgi:hypothetical protein
MKKYYLQGNASGLFFVLGVGFIAADKNKASQLTNDQIAGAVAAGFGPATKIEVVVSYAVNYIRQTDLDANLVVKANAKNPSSRRFATRDEANQHGSRFNVRKAAKGAPEGSAGHIGYYVTESTDPVNAVINWKTGLTNPL